MNCENAVEDPIIEKDTGLLDGIEESDSALPRLHANSKSLTKWVVRHGGLFEATITESRDGWSLTASEGTSMIKSGDVLIRVPKTLCIHSDPAKMAQGDLLKNTQALMNSLSPHHWRARLAIALLSERVRSRSNYRSYLRNLPFEFWGMPVFFSTGEFALMQDYALMQKTKDRCKFMSEFADSVLKPLQGSPRDPFSGNSADVNAFGWGFASASSRALREIGVRVEKVRVTQDDSSSRVEEGEGDGDRSGAVMVPGIDIAHHAVNPNCEVVETVFTNEEGEEKMCYELRALMDIDASSEGHQSVPLTISYGEYSNDDLLSDYGFTVADNPHDTVHFLMDGPALDTARVVMGQSKESILTPSTLEEQKESLKLNKRRAAEGDIPPASHRAMEKRQGHKRNENENENENEAILCFPQESPGYPFNAAGHGTLRYNENFLRIWQVYWLRCLGLSGRGRDYRMQIKTGQSRRDIAAGGTASGPIDPRLWAFLRILYAPQEENLLAFGYTPFTLGAPGAMLDCAHEAEVIKTIVGVLGVEMGRYSTDIESDVALLQSEDEDLLLDSATSTATASLPTSAACSRNEPTSAILAAMVGNENRELPTHSVRAKYLDDLLVDSTKNDGLSPTGSNLYPDMGSSIIPNDGQTETSVARIRRVLRDILRSNDQINEIIGMERASAGAAAVATAAGVNEGRNVTDIVSAADAAVEATLRNIRKEKEKEKEKGDSVHLNPPHSSTLPQIHFTIDTSEGAYCEIGADGTLSPNVRQAMLYRIRKKKGLRSVVKTLGSMYGQLQEAIQAMASQNEKNGNKNGGSGKLSPLLPSEELFALDNKVERTRRITDLVAEVVGKEGSEEAQGEKILGTASKLSEKWEAKGLEL